MRSLDKFINEYEALNIVYPELYMTIKDLRGKKLWRIQVFGKDLALLGDAELIKEESQDIEEASENAFKKLKDIPKQVEESIKIKSSGRKVGKNNGIS